MSDVLPALTVPTNRLTIGILPLVSFLMPTYGRVARQPEIINEAVWWATHQTYPNVEVLILNDAPKQELVCLHPQVRVINWPNRIHSLGMKYNLATLLAAGSICCWCEDDDISLPNRAAQAVDGIFGFDYYAPMRWYYAQKGSPPVIDGNGYGFSSSAYRRECMIGRFADTFADVDCQAHKWVRENLRCNIQPVESKDVSYIYRWGVSDLHLSGHSDPQAAYEHCPPGKDGAYEITPTKFTDWVEEIRSL